MEQMKLYSVASLFFLFQKKYQSMYSDLIIDYLSS